MMYLALDPQFTRRLKMFFAFLAVVFLGSCASTNTPREAASESRNSSPGSPSEATLKQVEAITTLQTSQQSTLSVPAGWWFSQTRDVVTLRDPERELYLWALDFSNSTLEEAIEQGWKAVRPQFAREVDQIQDPPAEAGWDAVRVVSYQTAPKESRVVQAYAKRKDNTVYLFLIDAPIAAAQRRGAQLGQIVEGRKPKGFQGESFADQRATPWNDEKTAALEAFIQEGIKDTSTPGLAIVVLQDDQVVFKEGYGATRPSGSAITPQTRFMIGSTSKSLTSLMMARLVEAGDLKWSDPLQKHLPAFELPDAQLAERIEMQHSVCACTGLPRQDMEFLFQFQGISTEERLKELYSMQPTTGFQETFQYSNALVSAGGFAAARARFPDLPFVEAYQRALQETVIEPLNLQHTGMEPAPGTFAYPHGRGLSRQFAPIPLSYEDAVKSVLPAGGLWSSATDLAKIIRMELAEGRFPKDAPTSADERFLSREILLRRRQPMIQLGNDSHYGLALVIREKNGLQSVGHGGNTLGFSTRFEFFPQHNIGIVILTNAQAHSSFLAAIERRILELTFPTIEERAASDLAFSVKAYREKVATLEEHLSLPAPSDWIDPFLGSYAHEVLGELHVRQADKRFIVDVGEWQSEVGRFEKGGSQLLMLTDPPLAGITFVPKPNGDLLLDAGQQKYVFSKQ